MATWFGSSFLGYPFSSLFFLFLVHIICGAAGKQGAARSVVCHNEDRERTRAVLVGDASSLGLCQGKLVIGCHGYGPMTELSTTNSNKYCGKHARPQWAEGAITETMHFLSQTARQSSISLPRFHLNNGCFYFAQSFILVQAYCHRSITIIYLSKATITLWMVNSIFPPWSLSVSIFLRALSLKPGLLSLILSHPQNSNPEKATGGN